MSDEEGYYRKIRKPPTQGKGDRNRISNNEAFREGWERIFGNARNKQSTKKKTGR